MWSTRTIGHLIVNEITINNGVFGCLASCADWNFLDMYPKNDPLLYDYIRHYFINYDLNHKNINILYFIFHLLGRDKFDRILVSSNGDLVSDICIGILNHTFDEVEFILNRELIPIDQIDQHILFLFKTICGFYPSNEFKEIEWMCTHIFPRASTIAIRETVQLSIIDSLRRIFPTPKLYQCFQNKFPKEFEKASIIALEQTLEQYPKYFRYTTQIQFSNNDYNNWVSIIKRILQYSPTSRANVSSNVIQNVFSHACKEGHFDASKFIYQNFPIDRKFLCQMRDNSLYAVKPIYHLQGWLGNLPETDPFLPENTPPKTIDHYPCIVQ